MAKRTRKARPEMRRPKNLTDGQRTYREHDKVIRTHSVGAVPIINRLLDRMQLHDFLTHHIKTEDKRTIEKRFSQLKTDFCVAPVYLKNVTRIVGLLTVYFFALTVQSLLERELRNAMQSSGHESLPLYPEGRACTRPTTRKVIDLFEPIARHTISTTGRTQQVFHAELAPIQRTILTLLKIPTKEFRSSDVR